MAARSCQAPLFFGIASNRILKLLLTAQSEVLLEIANIAPLYGSELPPQQRADALFTGLVWPILLMYLLIWQFKIAFGVCRRQPPRTRRAAAISVCLWFPVLTAFIISELVSFHICVVSRDSCKCPLNYKYINVVQIYLVGTSV